jgi:hypothetical protein
MFDPVALIAEFRSSTSGAACQAALAALQCRVKIDRNEDIMATMARMRASPLLLSPHEVETAWSHGVDALGPALSTLAETGGLSGTDAVLSRDQYGEGTPVHLWEANGTTFSAALLAEAPVFSLALVLCVESLERELAPVLPHGERDVRKVAQTIAEAFLKHLRDETAPLSGG